MVINSIGHFESVSIYPESIIEFPRIEKALIFEVPDDLIFESSLSATEIWREKIISFLEHHFRLLEQRWNPLPAAVMLSIHFRFNWRVDVFPIVGLVHITFLNILDSRLSKNKFYFFKNVCYTMIDSNENPKYRSTRI